MKVKLRLTPSSRLGVDGVEGDVINVDRETAQKLLAAKCIEGPLPEPEIKTVPRDPEPVAVQQQKKPSEQKSDK